MFGARCVLFDVDVHWQQHIERFKFMSCAISLKKIQKYTFLLLLYTRNSSSYTSILPHGMCIFLNTTYYPNFIKTLRFSFTVLFNNYLGLLFSVALLQLPLPFWLLFMNFSTYYLNNFIFAARLINLILWSECLSVNARISRCLFSTYLIDWVSEYWNKW